MLALIGFVFPAFVASLLFSWIGLAILVVYGFVVAAFFEDDWWFKGLLFLALPVWLAFEVGGFGFPGWVNIGWIAGAYFVVGIIWSFFKWVILVTDLKKDITEFIKPGTKHDNGNTGRDQEYTTWDTLDARQKAKLLWGKFFDFRAKYDGFVDRERLNQTLNITPTVSSILAKAKIFSWIAYWPFSLLKYAFERLLKDLVDFMIERLKGVYNLIAISLMKGFSV